MAETIPEVIDGKLTIGQIKVRDRARFCFNYEGEMFLKKDALTKVKMPLDNFWVLSLGADHDDNPYGEGLAHALYWPVFFKRNCIKFWLIFLEKFSMPTGVAKLSKAQLRTKSRGI